MAKVVLITGGSRSGKSRYAQELAQESPGEKLFVATCPRVDGEMDERIRRHREDRAGRGWRTVEEEVDLEGVLRRETVEMVLVDCLTLWINNLMYSSGREEDEIEENEIECRVKRLLSVCAEREGEVVFVTNEVGLGIVPENQLARRYRDLVGRCNQTLAAGADRVVFMVSGLPLALK
jgi:adenosylcobinamide kinase / adenosylcobinamide-phosphate guanylyltransferase